MSEHEPSRGEASYGTFECQEADGLTALSEEPWSELVGELAREEWAVRHRRRLVQGRIGHMRLKIVLRDGAALPAAKPVFVGQSRATEAL